MSGFVSRWVVRRICPVGDADLDESGSVRPEVVERWLSEIRAEYLERCQVLRELQARSGLEFQFRLSRPVEPARLGTPTAVAVSAGATELLPDSITLAFRLRPRGGTGDDAVNASGVLALVDPATGVACELGDDVRDELIALEHAAQHTN